MPEGDTIYRAATLLRAALDGRTLTRFSTPRPVPGRPPEPGEGIEDVTSRGKHLLIRFTGGTTLHTHMRMTGTWRIFSPGEPWRRSPSQVRVVIETPQAVAVCASAPVVELLDTGDLRRHPVLTALGPDLCDPQPDLEEALRRMAGLMPATPVGEALLEQRVAAGIGNVYRSEVLWLCERSLPHARRRSPRDEARPPADRPPAAPAQPRAGAAPHGAAGPGRVRACRPAVPAVRHPHPGAPLRRAGAHHVVVSRMPGAPSTWTARWNLDLR